MKATQTELQLICDSCLRPYSGVCLNPSCPTNGIYGAVLQSQDEEDFGNCDNCNTPLDNCSIAYWIKDKNLCFTCAPQRKLQCEDNT